MKRRKLNVNKTLNFIIIIICLIILTVLGFKVHNDFFNKKDTQIKKELDVIEPYNYKLDDKDTKIYKKYFKELNSILKEKKVDEKSYAKLLTKLFIIDFYTLDNKLTSTDIGSLEFIHKDMIDSFITNAQENIYKIIKNNLYSDRLQQLPIVKDVEINKIEKIEYEYNKEKFIGYKLDASWEYEEDMGYESKGTIVLIKDNNKLNIVKKMNEVEIDEN